MTQLQTENYITSNLLHISTHKYNKSNSKKEAKQLNITLYIHTEALTYIISEPNLHYPVITFNPKLKNTVISKAHTGLSVIVCELFTGNSLENAHMSLTVAFIICTLYAALPYGIIINTPSGYFAVFRNLENSKKIRCCPRTCLGSQDTAKVPNAKTHLIIVHVKTQITCTKHESWLLNIQQQAKIFSEQNILILRSAEPSAHLT